MCVCVLEGGVGGGGAGAFSPVVAVLVLHAKVNVTGSISDARQCLGTV